MVTIKDVAQVAGVSVKTVSRVLTGNGYASDETRAKVQRAAQKLGYVPNRAASSLVTGRTMAIGMVVPNISSGFTPLSFSAPKRRHAKLATTPSSATQPTTSNKKKAF